MRVSYLILLSLVAGYCDTATFIHMNGVFSAHVTGNFVMFAVAMSEGVDASDYIKLATFPVFVLAVVVATLWFGRQQQVTLRHRLLPAGVGLLLAAITSMFLPVERGTVDVIATLLVVFALGSQNALHHNMKGPMTTVMTGIVTRTTALMTTAASKGQARGESQLGLSLAMIAAFTAGCICGAFATVAFGLDAILLPAIILMGLALHNASYTESKT